MRLLILTILLIINSACSMSNQVDPELVPYIQEVSNILGGADVYKTKEGLPINYELGKLPHGKMGECSPVRDRDGGFKALVVISIDFWPYLSESSKIQLIAHEIGHCSFGIGHTGSGLMQPTHIEGLNYEDTVKLIQEGI